MIEDPTSSKGVISDPKGANTFFFFISVVRSSDTRACEILINYPMNFDVNYRDEEMARSVPVEKYEYGSRAYIPKSPPVVPSRQCNDAAAAADDSAAAAATEKENALLDSLHDVVDSAKTSSTFGTVGLVFCYTKGHRISK